MTIDFKQDILAPVAQDFATMDTFINEGITSKVALVMAVSKHVVEAGGKRMRPIMCLLAAKACGAEDLERQGWGGRCGVDADPPGSSLRRSVGVDS